MATKKSEKPQKESKKSSDKKSDNSNDMGIGQDFKNGMGKLVDKLTGKGKVKPEDKKEVTTNTEISTVEHSKPILPEGATNETSKSVQNPPSILPSDNSIVPKVKAETKKTKSKFFSDTIHEIKTDIAVFLGGIITVNRGLKIHRVEEKKFLLSGVEQKEGQAEWTPFEVLFPDALDEADRNALLPDWYATFQKELDSYEANLKADAKAQSLIPKPKVGVDAPPPIHAPHIPITYATSGVDDMIAYANMIHKQYSESHHFAKHGKTFSPLEVENNLKKETNLYKFALKFDQKNRGWYIDMQQGNNFVRIPREPTEFLPIK